MTSTPAQRAQHNRALVALATARACHDRNHRAFWDAVQRYDRAELDSDRCAAIADAERHARCTAIWADRIDAETELARSTAYAATHFEGSAA